MSVRKKPEEWFRTIHADGSVSQTNRLNYEEEQKALNARRALGRYTLDEAALILAGAKGERAGDILKKWMQDAGIGKLSVYEPGKKARFPHNDVREHRTYLEVYGCDLDTWLMANEPRIGSWFTSRSAAPTPNAPPQEIATPHRRNRLYQEVEMIEGWRAMTEARIATTLSDKTVIGTCVISVTADSISWIDGQGGKQKTLRTSFKKWLRRNGSKGI